MKKKETGITAFLKIRSIILMSALIIFIFLPQLSCNRSMSLNSTAFIQPPMGEDNNVPFESFSINTNKDTIVYYSKTGSSIKIPSNAFEDNKGNKVTGPVEIKYREFHDPIDFFLSGTPMTYDSSGVQYNFESAGMFDIKGFSNGQAINISKDAPLKVGMTSYQSGDKFNSYELDTIERKWKYIGENTSKQASSHAIKIIYDSTLIKERGIMFSPAEKSVPPGEFEKNIVNERYRFQLDIKPEEFPELAAYKGLVFEVGEENKNYNFAMSNETWDWVILERGKQAGQYIITLSREGEDQKLIVYPSGDNTKEMDQKFDIYSKEKKKQDIVRANKKRATDSIRVAMENLNKIAAQLAISKSEAYNTESMVQREFIVSKFGTYNSDCPASMPKGEMVAAYFADTATVKKENRHFFNLDKVYLVERGRNVLYSVYNSTFKTFSYDPSKSNTIWAVSANNELLVFRNEFFSKKKRKEIKSDSCIFHMDVISIKTKNPKALRNLLGV